MDFARREWEVEEEEMAAEEEPILRWGGAQADEEGGGDDEERKRQERERKKAEVRKRLEESNKKKAKKGFLTPERKKKLRKLLMIKAAEDLKAQQLKKEQERQKILSERTIKLPDVDSMSDQGALEKIAKEMVAKIAEIEDKKYDLDFQVRAKDHEINELSIAVNDLRGKFVKPTLKKVSKYDNKFKKMAGSNPPGSMKVNFRENLKIVKQDKYGLEDLKGEKKEDEEGAEAPAE